MNGEPHCVTFIFLKPQFLRDTQQIREASAAGNVKSFFYCTSCPYSCRITHPRSHKSAVQRKIVDDILGGAAAWEHVDRTMTVCPCCNHNEAYFMQMQIRSADEPMSVFYKCVKCAHQWNEK